MRDEFESTRCIASDRRRSVVAVRVLVRTDASIGTRILVLPPGRDLGDF